MNDDRYHDVAQDHDPALAPLLADLAAVHGSALPPQLRAAISLSVREGAQAIAATKRRGLSAPSRTGGMLAAGRGLRLPAIRSATHAWTAFLASMLVTACVLLLVALTRQAGSLSPGIQHPSGPLTTRGYTSSVCGFRITITHAYADANRVLVRYAIAPPAGRTFLNGFRSNDLLSTQQGVALQGGGSGSGYRPEDVGSAGTRFTTLGHANGNEQFDVFETNGDTHYGRSATFVFSIPSLQTTEFTSGAAGGQQCERSGAAGAGLRQVTIAGPFTVRFTVPLQPSRRASLHWVIGTGTTREVVERIVVTPTETRIYVLGSGIYRPQIEVGGVQHYHGPNNMSRKQGNEYVLAYDDYATYFHSLYHKPSPWTLAVLAGSTAAVEGTGLPFATLRVSLS